MSVFLFLSEILLLLLVSSTVPVSKPKELVAMTWKKILDPAPKHSWRNGCTNVLDDTKDDIECGKTHTERAL